MSADLRDRSHRQPDCPVVAATAAATQQRDQNRARRTIMITRITTAQAA